VELALAHFEQYINRRFGQSSTPKHYLSDLRIFIRIIGKAVKDVTHADIDAFVDDQIAQELRPATINRRLACIHSFFEQLAAERPEHHWPNPVINRRHKLKTGSRLPRDASDEDVSKIFAVISDERDRAMFGLMVGASLRVGEVSTLQPNDIEESISPGSLAKLRVHGKGGKERVVWLTPSLWHALQDWLDKRPDVTSDRVFLNWRNQPITVSGIQYRFKQHCLAAGVQASCHELRHTFARRLVEAGLPVYSLSELLALGLDDLDLAAERAIVRGSKPGRDRVVFLTPALVEALQRYLSRRPDLPDEERVFVLRGRSPTPRTIQRRLKKYGRNAGVDVSPHKLRHTLATRLLNQGMPIHSLRKLLGHQHLNTTQIYARIYDQTLYRQFREATARLDGLAASEWQQMIRTAPVEAEVEVA
jgi:site-specific recombinase XerD